MFETPWSDGTPGISQAQIGPGCSFTYTWKATQHGSYFYHAHSASQVNDGLYGPIVIHPAPSTPAPYELITTDPASLSAIQMAEKTRMPLLISDWRHIESQYEWESSQQSGVDTPCLDSILVNGKGKVNCLSREQQAALITPNRQMLLSLVPGTQLTDKSCAPPSVITKLASPGAPPPDYGAIPPEFFNGCSATAGSTEVIHVAQKSTSDETWVMFDLISSLSLQQVQFSLDELTMYVIAADGNYIEPEAVQSLELYNGQRYTVLAKLEQPKKYTMRISGTTDTQMIFANALLDFEIVGVPQSTQSTVPYINEVGQNTTCDVKVLNPNAIKPYLPDTIPKAADVTYKLTTVVGGQVIYWAFNQTILPLETEDLSPLLLSPQPGRQDNHTITNPPGGVWVDYVLQVAPLGPPHPMHIHGRHFYVLGQGVGPFPWADVAEAQAANASAFNLVNPQLRDTFPTPPSGPAGSWLVLRRRSDNPGVWLMHCHTQSHIQGGQSMIIQDSVDTLPAIPTEYSAWQC